MSEPLYDITDDVKRDVLAATDLVQLIGAMTSLKKAGRSWKGLCPFHTEKSPSFHVHPDKGFYYCFGCGAKGDAITFVRETERLEFPDAVAYLARLAGIALPMRRSGTRVDRGKETRAAEALSLAAAFFRANLDTHPAARALLEKRGLTPEEGHAHGFGAALDAWDALKISLSPRVQEDALIEAGLLQKNPETGRVYDRFRNRLTIEIRDGRGEILGFGARAFGDDQPKYLNSPETARFSKGKLLYGLDRAKEAIRKEETAILVEGYFDRIACERAGAANAVASMARRSPCSRQISLHGMQRRSSLLMTATRRAERPRSRCSPCCWNADWRSSSSRFPGAKTRIHFSEIMGRTRFARRFPRKRALSPTFLERFPLRRDENRTRRLNVCLESSNTPPTLECARTTSRRLQSGSDCARTRFSDFSGRNPPPRRLSRRRMSLSRGIRSSCRNRRRVCSQHFSLNGRKALRSRRGSR